MPSLYERDLLARRALEAATWRRFTLVAGRSDKFWRVRSAERFYETWWGRTGTNGQRKVKEVTSSAAIIVRGLIAEKVQKGYVDDDAPPGAPAPPRPPVPQVDPLTGRVAVWAQRDVRDERGTVIHRRGFKQVLPPAVAAEVCTGSLDYGYGEPVNTGLYQATRAWSEHAATHSPRLPHIFLPSGSAQRVPLNSSTEDLTVWGVSYVGSVFTGTAREVRGRIYNLCTNSAQSEAATEALRVLIAQGGGRHVVTSARGTALGEMTVSRQSDAVRAAQQAASPQSWRCQVCTWTGPWPVSSEWGGRVTTTCPSCGGRAGMGTATPRAPLPSMREIAVAALARGDLPSELAPVTHPAPAPAATANAPKLSIVALGRFTGLDEDEEEI